MYIRKKLNGENSEENFKCNNFNNYNINGFNAKIHCKGRK